MVVKKPVHNSLRLSSRFKLASHCKLLRRLLFGLFALCLQVTGQEEESVELEALIEQLPAEIAANRVDPLTIDKNIPFTSGEHMKFKLGWSIFKVAKAELDVSPVSYDELAAFRITMKTRTNSFADSFYRVRNRSTSTVATDVSRSIEYRAEQEEGDRQRDTAVFFDAEQGTARYVNNRNGENRAPIAVAPGTFDPLGIVFFVRCLDLEVGDELVIPTSNGKEFFFTIVRVTRQVNRKFMLGRFDALVLEPDIKDLGGVFRKSPNGKIKIYLSADERKLPLRMESEVAVGSFWAELSAIDEENTIDTNGDEETGD